MAETGRNPCEKFALLLSSPPNDPAAGAGPTPCPPDVRRRTSAGLCFIARADAHPRETSNCAKK